MGGGAEQRGVCVTCRASVSCVFPSARVLPRVFLCALRPRAVCSLAASLARASRRRKRRVSDRCVGAQLHCRSRMCVTTRARNNAQWPKSSMPAIEERAEGRMGAPQRHGVGNEVRRRRGGRCSRGFRGACRARSRCTRIRRNLCVHLPLLSSAKIVPTPPAASGSCICPRLPRLSQVEGSWLRLFPRAFPDEQHRSLRNPSTLRAYCEAMNVRERNEAQCRSAMRPVPHPWSHAACHAHSDDCDSAHTR